MTDHVGQNFAQLLNQYDYQRPQRWDFHEATLLSVGEHDLVVDLGCKQDGIIPPKDLEILDDEAYVADLEVGEQIPVVVLKPRGEAGEVVVSVTKGLQHKDWLRAEELLKTEDVLQAPVIDYNRGGALVRFGRLRGFVPNSHLTCIPRGLRGDQLREAKAEVIGDTLSLVVIEVKKKRRRLILSERKAMNHQKRQELLEELTEGEVRTGVVRNIVDFGAFVDLGGIDGLVHISEIDWQHVDNPSDVLNVGETLEVYVLDVDRERERVSLSRKRMLPDPWQRVIAKMNEGDVVLGNVTDLVDFGAFVDVGDGVEGLLHISEIPGNGDGKPDLNAGSEIAVRILKIDEWQRQISLGFESLDAVDSEAEGEEEAAEPEGEEETAAPAAEEELAAQAA